MDLRQYLFNNRMTVTEFSQLIGYSRPHISGIISGHLHASPRLAKVIENATKKKVTIKEVLTVVKSTHRKRKRA